MAIEYSDNALLDLEEIDRYTVLTWNEGQALVYLQKLRKILMQLDDFPEIGQSDRSLGTDVRVIRAEEHLVIYRSRGNRNIRILRVLHKNRLVDASLLED